MVDRVFYPPQDSRRYSRGLPPSFAEHRHRYPAALLQDSSISVSSSSRTPKIMGDHRDSAADAPTRKRISVACGRCRKRKIRCSGDPGNGEPCNNCRNANAETCQFLRVASQETPLLTGGSFTYDIETARVLSGGGMSPPISSSQFTHEIPDSMSRYPTSSTAVYPYGTRYYQNPAAAGWSQGYSEGNVDYSGLSYGSSYYAPEGPYSFRVASGSTKNPATSHLYAESGAATVGYQCLQRTPVSVSVDSPSMSLSTVAAALPPAMSAPERMLPALGQKPMPGMSGYQTEHSAATAYHHGMRSAHPTSAESSPTGNGPEASAGHYHYDSSPVSAYTQPSSLPSVNGSSHRGSTSTSATNGYGSEAYSDSSTSGGPVSTGTTSLYDAEPASRGGLHDFAALKCDRPAYTLQAGPIPSPSIAGRGLLQTHAATAPTYMISGGSHTSATTGTGTESNGNSSTMADTARDHHVHDSGTATVHSEGQLARAAATSLSAA